MGSSRGPVILQASRRVFGRSGPLEMVGEFPGVLMLSKAANVRTESLPRKKTPANGGRLWWRLLFVVCCLLFVVVEE